MIISGALHAFTSSRKTPTSSAWGPCRPSCRNHWLKSWCQPHPAARESGIEIEPGLIDVHPGAEELLGGFQQVWMTAEPPVRLIVRIHAEDDPGRVRIPRLEDDFRAARGAHPLETLTQRREFLRGEQPREEEVSLAGELIPELIAKLHQSGSLPRSKGRAVATCGRDGDVYNEWSLRLRHSLGRPRERPRSPSALS